MSRVKETKITAHRGMGVLEKRRDHLLKKVEFYPENSLAAFKKAIEEGADALECDIHVTKDGHPMVIHGSKAFQYADYVGTDLNLSLNTPLDNKKSNLDDLQVEKFTKEDLQQSFALKSFRDKLTFEKGLKFDELDVGPKVMIGQDKVERNKVLKEKQTLLKKEPDAHKIPSLEELLALAVSTNRNRAKGRKEPITVNIELKGQGSGIASVAAIQRFMKQGDNAKFLKAENIVFLGRREVGEITIANALLKGKKDLGRSELQTFVEDLVKKKRVSLKTQEKLFTKELGAFVEVLLKNEKSLAKPHLRDFAVQLLNKQEILGNLGLKKYAEDLLKNLKGIEKEGLEKFTKSLLREQRSLGKKELNKLRQPASLRSLNEEMNRQVSLGLSDMSTAIAIESERKNVKKIIGNLSKDFVESNKEKFASINKNLELIHSVALCVSDQKTIENLMGGQVEFIMHNINEHINACIDDKHVNIKDIEEVELANSKKELKDVKFKDLDGLNKKLQHLTTKNRGSQAKLNMATSSLEILRCLEKKESLKKEDLLVLSNISLELLGKYIGRDLGGLGKKADAKKKPDTPKLYPELVKMYGSAFSKVRDAIEVTPASLQKSIAEEPALKGIRTNLMVTTGQLFGPNCLANETDFDTRNDVNGISKEAHEFVVETFTKYKYDGVDVSLYDFCPSLVKAIQDGVEHSGHKNPIMGITASNWKGSSTERAPQCPMHAVIRCDEIARQTNMDILLKVDEPGMFKDMADVHRGVKPFSYISDRYPPDTGYKIDLRSFGDVMKTKKVEAAIPIIHRKPPRGTVKESTSSDSPLISKVPEDKAKKTLLGVKEARSNLFKIVSHEAPVHTVKNPQGRKRVNTM